MNKKLIGMFVCVLLIATTLPAIGNSEDSKIKNSEVEMPHCNYYYGCAPLPDTVIPDEIGELGPYPSSWDWRDAEYSGSRGDWTTPVKSQGSCGSCWAFSAIGTLETIINIRVGTPNLDVDLSEQYLLSCPPNSGGCDGWSPYRAFEFMKNNGGAIPESCFPYQADDTVPCSDKCDDWLDHLIPIYAIKYYSRPNREAIKSIIVNDGPLSVSFDVYEDFHDYSGGVYRHEYGEHVSGHAVVLIGYDDSESCWICKNSWGRNWGENGYFRIGYGECELEKSVYFIDFADNWPPEADAGGPYYGRINEDIHFDARHTTDFDSEVVSYEWDFGDGTDGTGINPIHSYSNVGKYSVKQGEDETEAYVDETPPTISITKPKEKYLYFIGNEIIQLSFKTRIFGGMTIVADASDDLSGVEKVEFYINNELVEVDKVKYYWWNWESIDSMFGNYEIKVVVYDNVGYSASDEMTVWRGLF